MRDGRLSALFRALRAGSRRSLQARGRPDAVRKGAFSTVCVAALGLTNSNDGRCFRFETQARRGRRAKENTPNTVSPKIRAVDFGNSN